MLQDAIWADTEQLESDEEYADTAVKFLKAVIKGWVFARDNPEEAAEITLATRLRLGPQPRTVDDERDQQAHLAPPAGIGIIDEAAWNQTVEGALAAVNETGAHLITEGAAVDGVQQRVHPGGAGRARGGGGIDLLGEEFEPIEVELQAGGN